MLTISLSMPEFTMRLAVVLSVLSISSLFSPRQIQSIENYIVTEGSIAKAGVLANIGPNGVKSSGAKAGVVIASPSTTDPDYLCTWTRDSSLVFKMLIDQLTTGIDPTLGGLVDSFISAEANIQQVSNPSGSLSTGGLGEPKFNIDETAFTGDWGRPQRDGPPLRAIATITYANWLLQNGNSSFVESTLWPLIKIDLDYVSINWNLSTFDLWEEVDSPSFFTSAVQHRALREGITLASSIGQSTNIGSYPTQADNILCFMQSFWNPSGSYMTANTGGGRSGIDANTVLASIHTFDPAAGCDPTTFQPCSDKALINLLIYVNSFRSVYSINDGISQASAVATGRYSEDVYMGGNPWYLTVFAVAEQLYDALQVWASQGSLEITDLSLPFFQLFSPSVTTGTYFSATSTYETLTTDVKAYADRFVALNAYYTPSDGSLAEQYSKTDGTPLSAVDLTWSYASAITAFEARNGSRLASWGAAGLTVPSVCETQGGENALTIPVTINVEATTVSGENIYIVGSVDALQDWNTENALILSASNYPIWSITLELPINRLVQYKYIRIFNGDITWEADPNNQFTTPSSGGITLNDIWR